MSYDERKKEIAEKSGDDKKKGPRPIHYFKKHVYGNELNYMHDSDLAKHVYKLTGSTTLLNHHIDAFRALGHEVKHVPKH